VTFRKIIIYGNSGSGKTTMAGDIMGEQALPVLSLDDIAWGEIAVRDPLEKSIAAMQVFIDEHDEWIIEGCYGNLVEAALPHCSELIFINPGVERCVKHCRARPWEADKYPDPAEQDKHLAMLIEWVRKYDTREDEFGLARHQAIFDGFDGRKRVIS
jgi:adenylate kinase family enzyme